MKKKSTKAGAKAASSKTASVATGQVQEHVNPDRPMVQDLNEPRPTVQEVPHG